MVYDQSLLVGLCTQDYKSVCAGVTIWHTLVDITDTGYIDNIFISLYKQLN